MSGCICQQIGVLSGKCPGLLAHVNIMPAVRPGFGQCIMLTAIMPEGRVCCSHGERALGRVRKYLGSGGSGVEESRRGLKCRNWEYLRSCCCGCCCTRLGKNGHLKVGGHVSYLTGCASILQVGMLPINGTSAMGYCAWIQLFLCDAYNRFARCCCGPEDSMSMTSSPSCGFIVCHTLP